MGARLRAVEAAVELIGALALLGVARVVDGRVRPDYVTVGFASGFLYRHTQASAIGGGFRAAPLRNAVLALAWTPVHVAIGRSTDQRAGRRSFAAGINLGSAAYRLACRE